jgi:hypothetical protein
MLQVVGCACAQAPVGNAAMSGAPNVDSDASKIVKRFDMMPPSKEGLHTSSGSEAQQYSFCKALYDRCLLMADFVAEIGIQLGRDG